MSGSGKRNTLFEAVPALSSISAHGAGRAKLMAVGFDHPGFELVEGVNRIGRDPGQNHHVILSSHVSRSHCELLVSGGTIRVRDLASHNGTYVNGERINETVLKPGDKLGLSRRVTLMLAMDAELEKPDEVVVAMGRDEGASSSAPQGAPTTALRPAVSRPGGVPLLSSRSDAAAPSPVASESPLPSAPPVAAPAASAPAAAPAASAPGSPAAAPVEAAQVPISGVVMESQASAPAAPYMPPSIVESPDDKEPEPAVLLKQTEQQRNELAILYQIALRCLLADDPREAQKLLANVLQRLIPLEAGFLLYQSHDAWRASICPASKGRPTEQTFRAFHDLATHRKAPLVMEDPAVLAPLGMGTRGSALMVPLLLDGRVTGVIGAMAAQPGVYTPALVDLVLQVATIAAAALRDR